MLFYDSFAQICEKKTLISVSVGHKKLTIEFIGMYPKTHFCLQAKLLRPNFSAYLHLFGHYYPHWSAISIWHNNENELRQ